jgi:hypothetical protein
MTEGVALPRDAALVSAVCSFRRPARITAARPENSGSLVSGKASIAAVNICIAASTKLTMTGDSPSSSPPSPLDRFVPW